MIDYVEKAKQIAEKVHSGQFRRDGKTPYIEHPKRVASQFQDDPEAEATAWLHDVLEDQDASDLPFTPDRLLSIGIPETVVDAVVILTKDKRYSRTKDKRCSYHEYILNIANNPIARRVKIADMLHNLGDAPTEKQILKYSDALITLVKFKDCFFAEGAMDYDHGYDLSECPYDEGTDGECGWRGGWQWAEKH